MRLELAEVCVLMIVFVHCGACAFVRVCAQVCCVCVVCAYIYAIISLYHPKFGTGAAQGLQTSYHSLGFEND